MSSFTTPLIVSPMSDGRSWKLVAPFEYHVGNKQSLTVIIVPNQFITDFASVPRSFWGIIPPWGKYGKAAIVHDYLYCTKTYLNDTCTRQLADEIFYEAMLVLKVPKWQAKVMYYAVRWFGYLAWKYNKGHFEDFRLLDKT
jgi:hypothetical protein